MSTAVDPDAAFAGPRARDAGELKKVLSAEAEEVPFLTHRNDRGELTVTLLRGEHERVVGRNPDSDIPLAWDRRVSGVHCKLVLNESGWNVKDDELSRNGTFVNGARLSGQRRLRDGDTIRAGGVLLLYHDPSAANRDTTELSDDAPGRDGPSEIERRILTALCRPLAARTSDLPASDEEIAAETFLDQSVVVSHLTTLYERFGLASLPPEEQRAHLAELVLDWGLVHSDTDR